MTVWGSSWDASVYARIRQFHRGKGFDPDSQDLALYLGQPLYELPSEIDLPFAHIDNQHLHDIPEEQDPSGSITEPENVLESANADDGAVNASPAEEIPVSGTFTFVLVGQLSLILCLVLFWLYDRLWIWRFK
ncbi:hypothetical protein B0H14DRAFT_3512300 [Mycena olivaceomarginata]|nr:hypothetical protein B0H14DRAFT_3512300 [Mycena olivaceomarginata]